MMATYEATECAFQVDAGWKDQTRYLYQNEEIIVVSEPFASVAETSVAIEKVLERFRVSVPGYELVERRKLDQPGEGAELVAHRLGGPTPRFEIAVFWPIEDTTWSFRVQAPPASEERCRMALESFLQSYQPVEAP